MKWKVGFAYESGETETASAASAAAARTRADVPRKSVVQVHFPGGPTLAYYNDRFDLRVGDFVYVDGKLEGRQGRVKEVSYNFKIKLSDYKRVIALVDTAVKGTFRFAGSHAVTFDPCAIPAETVVRWFKAPPKEDEEFVSGSDEHAFPLEDLKSMGVTASVAERGHDYYMDNRVVYLCVDEERGYAIVAGSEAYEVEFVYRGGEISGLTCSCFCGYHCKHGFAAMLQLQEILARIGEHYAAEYERSGYFAAMSKAAFYTFAVDGSETATLTLS